MNLSLRNFGKIEHADIDLNGFTVICGDDNTGKSTIGKALFGIINSFSNYKFRIFEQRDAAVKNFVRQKGGVLPYSDNLCDLRTFAFLIDCENLSETELINFLLSFSVKATKEQVKPLLDVLTLSNEDILNESASRYFNTIMNGQIQNVYSEGSCSVGCSIGSDTYALTFWQNKCICSQETSCSNKAYYINNPFSLDLLNIRGSGLKTGNPLERNVIETILDAHQSLVAEPMNGILQTVSNKKNLEKVMKILKKAYTGDTLISKGMYYYSENNVKFDFRNISAGLKSFALIERLLHSGVLERGDILIFDEPELYLHSDWQKIYAELLVSIQKHFNLTILLVTHSSQFCKSLDFFMKKYAIVDKCTYYTPILTEKGVSFRFCDSNELTN